MQHIGHVYSDTHSFSSISTFSLTADERKSVVIAKLLYSIFKAQT